MEIFALSVVAMGGFWLWARGETLKNNPRMRRETKAQTRLTRPHQLTQSQQVLVWSSILGTQLLLMNRHNIVNSFDGLGSSGEGTGWGQVDDRNLANFPPPDLYQEIGGAGAMVTVINGSPEALNIQLVKDTGERVTLEMPRCSECRPYSEDEAPACGTVGTPMSFNLPAGQYSAKGRFFGTTKGFASDWSLSPGWEHRMCIYTLDEVTFY